MAPINLDLILRSLTGGFQPIGKGAAGRRAAAEAQLRYLPALQSLGLLGQQTQGQFRQDVRGVRRGGAAAASGIGAIRTGLLEQLGDTPAPTGEAAANLGLTRDAVAGDLARMQAQQLAGVQAGVSRLRGKRDQDLGQIVQQLFQTADQGRLYNVSQFEALAADAAKARREQKRWEAEQRIAAREARRASDQWLLGQQFQNIRDGRNPETGLPDPAYQDPRDKPKPKNGPGSATRSESVAFRKDFGSAVSVARKLKALGFSPAEVRESLASGQPAEPMYEDQPDPNKPGKTRRVRVGTTPGWDAFDDPLAINAAVDQAYFGGVRPVTTQKVREAGYGPARVGIDPYTRPEFRRARRKYRSSRPGGESPLSPFDW